MPKVCALLLIVLSSFSAKGQQEAVDLYANDTSVVLHESAIVQISVNKFTNIISFQASINWDPSMMTFVAVDSFGLKGLGIENFGTSNAEIGHIRVVWEPQDAVAVSLEDSTVLFSIEFALAGNEPGAIEVHFQDNVSNPAFPVEVANGDYKLLSVNSYSGTISFYAVITGLEEPANHTLIYPNPFTERIHIRHGEDRLDYVRVFSFTGELVVQLEQINEPEITLRLDPLDAGFYFVDLKKGNIVYRKKMLKIAAD